MLFACFYKKISNFDSIRISKGALSTIKRTNRFASSCEFYIDTGFTSVTYYICILQKY